MTAPWEETTLPTILSKYELNQIYNADEFGLFYRAQPEKSLQLKNDNCINGKHSKLRLMGLTAANAVGEKLPMFTIGKSKRKAGLAAFYSRNGFVKSIDTLQEGRKIALVVDNCLANPSIVITEYNLQASAYGSRRNLITTESPL